VYVWAVLLGNTELALQLLPNCQEPMRAAIIGAKLCGYMASQLPLARNQLEEAAGEHERFAITLLDLCETFEDARKMLTTKSRHWNRTVVLLGLQSGLRNFIAHTYCQTLCDEWYKGNTEPTEKEAILVNAPPGMLGMLQIIITAVMPMKVPFVPHMIKWDNDFGGPLDHTDPPMYQLYRIPAVKQILRLTLHICYTMFVSFAIMETGLQEDEMPANWSHLEFHEGGGLETNWTDGVLWVWTAALALDEWYKYNADASTFSMDFWNKYDYTVITTTFVALAMRSYSLSFAVEILAFNTILIWCRLFKYLGLNQSIGILVIMIMEMFKDIALWTLVSLIFMGGFTVAFVAISNPFVLHDSPDHPLTVPLWAMLGTFDVYEVQKWNPNVGSILLYAYVVVAQIILVNLLIAMMGDTFGVIKARADEEWKFGRLRSVMEATERMSPVPPPFNLPITLTAFILKYTPLGLLIKPGGADKAPYDYSKNKKAKGKVARKLMLKFKKREEELDEVTLGAYVEDLQENQQNLKQQLKDLMETVTQIKEAVDTKQKL